MKGGKNKEMKVSHKEDIYSGTSLNGNSDVVRLLTALGIRFHRAENIGAGSKELRDKIGERWWMFKSDTGKIVAALWDQGNGWYGRDFFIGFDEKSLIEEIVERK